MRILVTGGCGYVGSVLVPKLLAAGHAVRVVDLQWFGNYLAPHFRLNVINGDFREVVLGATDVLIHLAASQMTHAENWTRKSLGKSTRSEPRSLRIKPRKAAFASLFMLRREASMEFAIFPKLPRKRRCFP